MSQKCSGYTHSREQLNHYANQYNPNNGSYQARLDNHANQLNPNNREYRGNCLREEKEAVVNGRT